MLPKLRMVFKYKVHRRETLLNTEQPSTNWLLDLSIGFMVSRFKVSGFEFSVLGFDVLTVLLKLLSKSST